MSSLLQKLRHANHLLLLHKCTSDDSVSVAPDVVSKLISITYDGSISSRFIAMSLFEKLTKRSSTLSSKILPVICSIIREGSSDFKQEIRQKLYILKQLQESSLKCQGEEVHELFKELIELLEGDRCKGLLEAEAKCLALDEVELKEKPVITNINTSREENQNHEEIIPTYLKLSYDMFVTHFRKSFKVANKGLRRLSFKKPKKAIVCIKKSTISVVSPEVNIVQQITAPSCIDMLPPMVDLWRFSSSYKSLNQTRVNEALIDVLTASPASAKLKALAVLDYLTQQFPGSLGDQFHTVIEELVQSDNIDLRTKARNVHTKLIQRPSSRASSSLQSPPSPCTSEKAVEEGNLCGSHLKRSYDKIATVQRTRYAEDDAMLDLGTQTAERRSSASSMDFLLEPNC